MTNTTQIKQLHVDMVNYLLTHDDVGPHKSKGTGEIEDEDPATYQPQGEHNIFSASVSQSHDESHKNQDGIQPAVEAR